MKFQIIWSFEKNFIRYKFYDFYFIIKPSKYIYKGGYKGEEIMGIVGRCVRDERISRLC